VLADCHHRIPVNRKEQKAEGDEEGQEDVQHCNPALHEQQKIGGHQQRRNQRDPAVAKKPAGQQVDHQNEPDPKHKGADPPAERVVAEQLDAAGDQPFAQRGVHVALFRGPRQPALFRQVPEV
jgi:hypothetical protein